MTRPAAFLDRDGTLIVEREYLADPEGVELTPGAVAALRRLQQAGYALVLVTNQSGIGRGLYTLEDFRAVQARIEKQLAAEGITLDGVYFCPHHPDEECSCRKPGLALFRRAAEELDLDLGGSVFIGDRVRDVAPAAVLGGRAFLVGTGYGATERAAAGPHVLTVRDLEEAAARAVEG